MKKLILIPLLLGWMALGLAACQQEGLFSANLVLEGDHRLSSGEILRGLVLILDGTMVIEQGARLEGPVYMLGGRLESNGDIGSDLSLLGGELLLGSNALIAGDLNLGGGEMGRSPQATIAGRVNTGVGLQVPDRPRLFYQTLGEQLPVMLIQAILLAALAFLAVRWMPRPLSRISNALVQHPLVSIAIGLLVGVVALSLLVLIAFTIILIPVSLLGGFVFLLAVLFGWIAFGLVTGRFLARQFKRDLQPAPAAALGTLLFIFVMNMLALVPLIEGIVPLILAVTGLGAVFLTRFGLIEFVPATDRPEPDF